MKPITVKLTLDPSQYEYVDSEEDHFFCREKLEKAFPNLKGCKKINLSYSTEPFKDSLEIFIKLSSVTRVATIKRKVIPIDAWTLEEVCVNLGFIPKHGDHGEVRENIYMRMCKRKTKD